MKIWQPVIQNDQSQFVMKNRPLSSNQSNKKITPEVNLRYQQYDKMQQAQVRMKIHSPQNLYKPYRQSYKFQPSLNQNLVLLGVQFKNQNKQNQKKAQQIKLRIVPQQLAQQQNQDDSKLKKVDQIINFSIPDLMTNKFQVHKNVEPSQVKEKKLEDKQKSAQNGFKINLRLKKSNSTKILYKENQIKKGYYNRQNLPSFRRNKDILTPSYIIRNNSDFIIMSTNDKLLQDKQNQTFLIKNLPIGNLQRLKINKSLINKSLEINQKNLNQSIETTKIQKCKEGKMSQNLTSIKDKKDTLNQQMPNIKSKKNQFLITLRRSLNSQNSSNKAKGNILK